MHRSKLETRAGVGPTTAPLPEWRALGMRRCLECGAQLTTDAHDGRSARFYCRAHAGRARLRSYDRDAMQRVLSAAYAGLFE